MRQFKIILVSYPDTLTSNMAYGECYITYLLVYNKKSSCVGTGMGTAYHSMVLEESSLMPFFPGHTEREKSTLITMNIGQLPTTWVSKFALLRDKWRSCSMTSFDFLL